MRSKAVLALIFVAILGAGCSSESDDSGSASPTTSSASEGAANQVTMKLIAFGPEKLTVSTGSTVSWKQTDAGVHTVTSGTVEQGGSGVTQKPDGRFDSGQLDTDEDFEFTFDTPGTYPYFCEIHAATMRGEITVT